MYEFWYHRIKPKYQNNVYSDSFIIHIKTEDFYNTANNVKKEN